MSDDQYTTEEMFEVMKAGVIACYDKGCTLVRDHKGDWICAEHQLTITIHDEFSE